MNRPSINNLVQPLKCGRFYRRVVRRVAATAMPTILLCPKLRGRRANNRNFEFQPYVGLPIQVAVLTAMEVQKISRSALWSQTPACPAGSEDQRYVNCFNLHILGNWFPIIPTMSCGFRYGIAFDSLMLTFYLFFPTSNQTANTLHARLYCCNARTQTTI